MNDQQFLQEIRYATMRGDLDWSQYNDEYRVFLKKYTLIVNEGRLTVRVATSGGIVDYTYYDITLLPVIESHMRRATEHERKEMHRQIVGVLLND